MAKRLATEYVKACLQLSEAEMSSLMGMLTELQIHPMVRVLENGSQEVAFMDETTGEDVVITFEKKSGLYVMNGGFRITSLKLADVLRKTIIRCRGDAVVHRIYVGFTMAYHYLQGAVVKIVELTSSGERIVFELKDTLGKMQALYRKTDVEQEIRALQHEINVLLDQRVLTKDAVVLSHIDHNLSALTHRLFVLEA